MCIGFIGTGSMGSILIEAFIRSHASDARDIIASNRTRAKAERLAARFPGLRVASSNLETAVAADVLFLCVKPLEFKSVLDEIKPALHPSKILVSITSPVLIRHLEEQTDCKIAKVIPSITNKEMSGASLCIYGSRIGDDDILRLENKLACFSTPIRINEGYTRAASDISSCGPAFLAFFIEQFVIAAARKTGMPAEEANRLAGAMVLGAGHLLTSGSFTPRQLQERVSVPGGVTEEGLKILRQDLSGVFERLIETTHDKYGDDVAKMDKLFGNGPPK